MAQGGMPQEMKTLLGWVLGLGVIALTGLVMLILFGNLSGNVGFGQDSLSFYNETITLSDTGSTPTSASSRVNGALSSIIMTNATDGTVVASGNYSTSGVVFTPAEDAEYNGTSVNVSATVTYDSTGKVNTDNTIGNYTTSVTNTSSNFPTVGTIIGIAILLLILIALLIFAIGKLMGVAGSPIKYGKNSFSGNNRSSLG